MMSSHDALEAWQAGEITTARAMQLTGATDVIELCAFAHQSDVDIRLELLPQEAEQVKQAATLIIGLLLDRAAATGSEADRHSVPAR
jgi:hypothetical protein